jgi:hypothetical protein
MNNIGGAALVATSGWFAAKVCDVAASRGGLQAVALVGVFILIGAFGIAFGRQQGG